MRQVLCAGVLMVLVGALCTTASAQAPTLLTGNPTPGTPQPPFPKLVDRITLTGCLQRAGTGEKGSSPPVADANTPSDSRYILTKAAREPRVPPDTGTSSEATAAISPTYRLGAIESALSPFVGAKVEISGELEPPSPAAEGANAKAPTLRVEFVQKLNSSCR